ncbi:MAG: acyltransferase domain-containing protein [Azospirillaceae bacterium]|nr:acyltransferase domain-containing protein [Azospirillaceae bacterium]
MSVSGTLPVTFLFGGQGSQYYQMGAELFRGHPVFAEWMCLGDRFLRENFGRPILDTLYAPGRGLGDTFDALPITHPAIFMTEVALARTLEHHGIVPDQVAGVSLGEFAAMVVAGMMPLETALALVARQPEVYARHCAPGGMVAVLASPELWRGNPILNSRSELAGVSSDEHFVLSATAAMMPAIAAELDRLRLPYQALPVPFAFHSRWMEPAAEASRALTADVRLEAGRCPCHSASLQGWTTPDTPDLFWRIARGQMHVGHMVQTLEGRGGAIYVDLSPSGTLATLIRMQLPPDSRSQVFTILSPFANGLKAIDRLLAALRPAAIA